MGLQSSSLTRSRLGRAGRSVALDSSDRDRPMARLHRVSMGTLLLSRRSWSVHLVRGRLGERFHHTVVSMHEGSGGSTHTDSSTWRSMHGLVCGNVIWQSCQLPHVRTPNMALQPLVIGRSDTAVRIGGEAGGPGGTGPPMTGLGHHALWAPQL